MSPLTSSTLLPLHLGNILFKGLFRMSSSTFSRPPTYRRQEQKDNFDTASRRREVEFTIISRLVITPS
jgi:hypothetical protein